MGQTCKLHRNFGAQLQIEREEALDKSKNIEKWHILTVCRYQVERGAGYPVVSRAIIYAAL